MRSSVTHSISPEFITSASTLPAPTLGSWSLSPTSTSLVPGCNFFSSASKRKISTIENSSTITASHASGSPSETAAAPPILQARWTVLASLPVASLMRFAARPVGAISVTFFPIWSNTSRIHFIIVVLPVPGPPVTSATPDVIAALTASRWLGASVILLIFS